MPCLLRLTDFPAKLPSYMPGATISLITNAWTLGIITNLTYSFINNTQFWSMGFMQGTIPDVGDKK